VLDLFRLDNVPAIFSIDRSSRLDMMTPVMPIALGRDLEQAQRWFHALSDETRLQLLELLRGGEQCVCDLTGALGAAQSRLSFHLKTLKDAGLVTDRREGRWVYYALNPEALDGIAGFLSDLRAKPLALRLARRGCG
jgi:ArsR family transcriptional regulator